MPKIASAPSAQRVRTHSASREDLVEGIIPVDMLELIIQEPTIRTGHRANMEKVTYSYILSSASRERTERIDRRMLACCAMEWAFRVLPHDGRVCDAHLLPAPRSSKSQLSRRARILGLDLFPHVASVGVAIRASSSRNLVEFLLEEVGNDDDLFLRPLKLSDAPDSQPWMIRNERNYMEMATERYGAVLLFCLTPVSFEIVSSRPIGDLASTTMVEVAERCGIALDKGQPRRRG